MNFLKRYIGNKSFYREMLMVALPIAFQQLISAGVNLLDSAEIGRWGNITLGAGGSEVTSASIMIANRYFSTFDNIMIMLAISCTIFIAQYFGAKRYDKTKQVFGLALKLTFVFGLVAAVFGFVYRKEIIQFFATNYGTGAEMLYYGEQYLSIIAWTFIPYSLSVALSFCLRAIGKTKIPLLASGSAAVTNLILNYIFIYTLNQGVFGAAIATMIARFVELGILAYYFFRHKPIFYGTFKETMDSTLKFQWGVIVKGLPMVLAQVLTEVLAIFMFFAYARIDNGNAANIAAVNLSSKVVDLVVAFVGGMGTAAAIMVGTRLGAGKIEEAKQNARWQIGYILLVSLITVGIMISLIPAVEFVYDFQTEAADLLAIVMVVHAISLPFMFYSSNVIFITRAGGYTKAPMIITNIPYLLIKIPVVAFFVFIYPNLFASSTFLHETLSIFGLPASLVIFVFVIDRFIEVLRAILAFIVLHKAPWQVDITGSIKETEIIPVE
jgi:putative MATE family efflux protein